MDYHNMEEEAKDSCAPAAKGEETDCLNGALSQDRAETIVIIPAAPSEAGPPVKVPQFNAHRVRNFAIGSIICGCSCIGILALIYAIKASEKQKANFLDSANYWARRSRRMSFLSIGVWLSLLILVPLLIIFTSYVVAQVE